MGGSAGWDLAAYIICKFTNIGWKSLYLVGVARWLIMWKLYFAHPGLMSNLTGSKVIPYHFCSLLARFFLHPLYRVICKTIAKRGSLLDIKWVCSYGCAVILDHKWEYLEFKPGHGVHQVLGRTDRGHPSSSYLEGKLSHY